MEETKERAGHHWAVSALGWTTLVTFLLAMVVVVAALAFSVTVSGHSMEPTLGERDRLLVDPFGRDDVERFDVVESSAGGREISIVKRVVGMPGDEISVRGDQERPVALVRPEGEDVTYVVDSDAWVDGEIGTRTESCCQDDGTSLAPGKRAVWVTVPDDSYWLIGDNWGGSDDSRTFGFVDADKIQARIVFRIWPISSFGAVGGAPRLVPRG